MNTKHYFFLLVIACFFHSQIYPQNKPDFIKSWIQTSVQDFSTCKLNNLEITNNSGGEVRIQHPLQRVSDESRDDSAPRFITRDSQGNYYKTRINNNDIFIQKFSKTGIALNNPVRINDTAGVCGRDTRAMIALSDDHNLIVVWADLGYNQNEYHSLRIFGQIFIDDSVKSGVNFCLDPQTNGSGNVPVPFYNKYDQTYWIVYSWYNKTRSYNITVQKRSKSGEKIGENFFLNPLSQSKYEFQPSLLLMENKFLVTWEASETGVSNDLNIFARYYNLNGDTAGSIFQVNSKIDSYWKVNPWAAADNNGHVLICWAEEPGSINGQLIDYSGNKIREQIKLNKEKAAWNYTYADFTDDNFIISYISENTSTRLQETYVNIFRINYSLMGDMTSEEHDLGQSGIKFNNITWNCNKPENSNILFRIRTASSIDKLKNTSWYGPLDTSGYYSSGDEIINNIHNGDRYIQFKAYFSTAEIPVTPILNNLAINYSPSDSIAPAPPKGLALVPGYSSIELKWLPNSESDLANYIIYRGTQSRKYDSLWIKIQTADKKSFIDSSVTAGIKYYYAVIAVDSVKNSSDFSEEISGFALSRKFYISASGSDYNNGTAGKPFASIMKGISASVFGDSIIVLPGNYKENITLKEGVNLIGSGAQTTKLTNTPGATSIVTGAKNSLLKGFCLETGDATCIPVFCKNATMEITENKIIYTGSSTAVNSGINLMDTSASIISKNFIVDFPIGIRHLMGKAIIRNNIIVTNNTGIQTFNLPNPSIINNTVILSGMYGIVFQWNYDKGKVENNIVIGTDSTKEAVGIRTGMNGESILAYNNVWNIMYKYLNAKEGSGALSVDPKFRDLTLQDYRLTNGSPCINAGNPSAEFNNTNGTRNDMGAFGGPDPISSELTSQLAKSVSLSTVYASTGDTVSLSLCIDKPSGLLSGTFRLKYDSALLQYNTAVLSNQNSGVKINTSAQGGLINLSFTSDSMITGINSDFVIIKFIVSSNISVSTITPVDISDVKLIDALQNEVMVKAITNGLISIEVRKYSEHTVYVNCNSPAGGNGSYSHPFNSIQQGIDAAKFHDTVFVSAGEYNENLIMKNGIVLTGAGPKVTVLRPRDYSLISCSNINEGEISNFTFARNIIYPPTNVYVTMDNSSLKFIKNSFQGYVVEMIIAFDIKNNSTAFLENNSLLNTGMYVGRSKISMLNNSFEIADCMLPVYVKDSSFVSLNKNRITLKNSDRWLNIDKSSVEFKNNKIIMNGNDYSLTLSNVYNATVSNNIIDDKGGHGYGIIISGSKDVAITNNTILAKIYGILESGSTGKVYNNIISGSSNFGMSNSSIIGNYNDVWNNNPNYSNCSPGVNDIQKDPLFIDGEFHLAANSPCRNAGSPETIYNDSDGSRNDMGAYGGPGAELDSLKNSFSCGFRIDSVYSAGKDTVSLKLYGNYVNNLSDLNFIFSYDAACLNYLDAESAALTKGFVLTKSRITDNMFGLSFSSLGGISKNEGLIAELFFGIKNSTSTGSTVKFEGVTVKDIVNNNKDISELTDGKIIFSTVGVNDKQLNNPIKYNLSNNYPNPFNPVTSIRYSVPVRSHVELRIFDILGRLVKTLVDEYKEIGNYEVKFNAVNLSSGVYFYQIRAGEYMMTKKFVLQK